jgi:poly-gamma-glutamate capsule biosynthesis protein CapA/YwtB (metallophosphatase superfamily)
MNPISLFLCGDVMTGRGIDQILPRPCDPAIHEGYVESATGYVELAERVSGPIPRAVPPEYIWGDALAELDRAQPARRIINLETAVTRSGDWLAKGINYRMSPENIGCLTAAGIDCCTLANNHVLDWGGTGLIETLDTLHAARIATAGAGRNRAAAEAPAALPLEAGGRILVFAAGSETSGVPPGWAATDRAPGVDLLPDLSRAAAERLAQRIAVARRPGDVVVVSIHWGSNWGYAVPPEQTRFARLLIDLEAADIVHGHSSHHPRGIEIYRGRLILYGCGDFINDYEGISGHEAFRGDLVLMYLPEIEAASGRLLALDIAALRMRRFRLERATAAETDWLSGVLTREGRRFHTRARALGGNRIAVEPAAA